MYFQFLIEDRSTEILINHVMDKLKSQYMENDIFWNTKSFSGIGHLKKKGNALEQKTNRILNNLPMYMRGIGKALQKMSNAALIVVLDNDNQEKIRKYIYRDRESKMRMGRSDRTMLTSARQ